MWGKGTLAHSWWGEEHVQLLRKVWHLQAFNVESQNDPEICSYIYIQEN